MDRTMRYLFAALVILLGLTGAASAQTNCLNPPNSAGTPVVSASAEGSHILKASPGCIISGYVTTGAAAGFLMIFNATSAPADGAVTPQNCISVPATTSMGLNWAPQPTEWYSTGIVVVFSTTGCFTKTISNTAYFHALVQ